MKTEGNIESELLKNIEYRINPNTWCIEVEWGIVTPEVLDYIGTLLFKTHKIENFCIALYYIWLNNLREIKDVSVRETFKSNLIKCTWYINYSSNTGLWIDYINKGKFNILLDDMLHGIKGIQDNKWAMRIYESNIPDKTSALIRFWVDYYEKLWESINTLINHAEHLGLKWQLQVSWMWDLSTRDAFLLEHWLV